MSSFEWRFTCQTASGLWLFPPHEVQMGILMDTLLELGVPFLMAQSLAPPEMVMTVRTAVNRSDGRGMLAEWVDQHGQQLSGVQPVERLTSHSRI